MRERGDDRRKRDRHVSIHVSTVLLHTSPYCPPTYIPMQQWFKCRFKYSNTHIIMCSHKQDSFLITKHHTSNKDTTYVHTHALFLLKHMHKPPPRVSFAWGAEGAAACYGSWAGDWAACQYHCPGRVWPSSEEWTSAGWPPDPAVCSGTALTSLLWH